MKSELRYRPEIDGLRAIAVIPVVLFHAGFKTFSGGFIGVDVFFVVSGYLITSLIVKDIENGTFTFSGFYERRARRILPALFAMMLCCIPFAWLWMTPFELRAFSTSVISVVVFASNILFWRQSGYFDTTAELEPLLHTWSLAVEEQFYVISPIALLLLWRFGKRTIIIAIALSAIGSFILCEYASRTHPSFNFYWAITRAWELAVGSLSSFVFVRRDALRDNALSAVGLAGIIASVFWLDDATRFPSAYALLPVIGTALVLLFGASPTLAARLLSLRPLVGVGLISYSVYLWHQPLLVFARIRSLDDLSSNFKIAICLLSFVIASASWRFVELPWRSNQCQWFSRRSMIVGSGAALCCTFIGFGLFAHVTRGAPFRFSADVEALAAYSYEHNERRHECFSGPSSVIDPNKSCVYGNGNVVSVAIFGDSHAEALVSALGNSMESTNTGVRELAYAACPPIPDFGQTIIAKNVFKCDENYSSVMSYLTEHHEISIVIVHARWNLYIEGVPFDNMEGGRENETEFKLIFPGSKQLTEQAYPKEAISRSYRVSINNLLALGKRVVLVYPVPEVGWDVPVFLSKLIAVHANIDRPLSTSYEVFKNRSIDAYRAFDAIPDNINLLRVKPEEILCNTRIQARCVAERNGIPLYRDSNHLSLLGASMLSDDIVAAMQKKGWLPSKEPRHEKVLPN
jgi:peptidoglycan/LPS O-acetylase OafA/YrhL